MAKKAKKAKASTREAPRAKPSGNRGVVIGVIVAVIVIIILIVLLRGKQEAIAPTGPTGPTAPTTEKKMVDLAPTPEFNSKCASADKVTGVTLTYVPGTCKTDGGSLAFTMKNPTKSTDVEGAYFEVTSATGKKSYVVNNEIVAPGETQAYTVNLNDLAAAIGETVRDFIVYPSQAGKACLNSRSMVIKQQSCV